MKEERQLQLLVCTANLGNEIPDDDSLAAWIPSDGRCVEVCKSPQKYPIRKMNQVEPEQPADFECYKPTDQFDLIVVGMQEATFDPPKDPEGGESFIRIQVPVVQPFVRKGVKKTVDTVSNLTADRDHTKQSRFSQFTIKVDDWDDGTAILHSLLDSRLPSYERIVSYQRGQMRLEVYGHGRQVEIEVLNVAAQNTGLAGLANKGGIVAELLIDGQTRLAFLTAHLEAHEGPTKYQTRCSTLGDIFSGTTTKLHDFSLSSHFAFAMGDLNFRTELPDSDDISEEEHKSRVQQMVAKEDWQGLNDADELHRALRQKECLVGFQTLFCNFPPTFKVERQSGYIYINKRRPSYTDRVLWKTNHESQNCVRPLLYEPIDDFASSDHKPVRAAFTVELNEPFSMRPKMARHRSMINLGHLLSSKRKKRSGSGSLASKEKLYLFVSQICCEIAKEREMAQDLYVLLTSTPKEAIRLHVTKWNKWKSRILRRSIATENMKDGSKTKTAGGWPRTRRMSGTCSFSWGEEDVHCEIKTHFPDGSPIDLTGAMLRLTLMCYNQAGDDTVVGTFCFNLAKLIRSCRKHEGSSLLVRKVGRESQPRGSDNFSSDDRIRGVDIDEPLLKNGQETGSIKCTIEAWWMDPGTARMVASGPTFIGHDDGDVEGVGTTQKILLSGRRTDRSSPKRRGEIR